MDIGEVVRTRPRRRSGGRAGRVAVRAGPAGRRRAPGARRDARRAVQAADRGRDRARSTPPPWTRWNRSACRQAPPSGVEILTGAGAIQGDDGRIRFPRALVEDMLAVAGAQHHAARPRPETRPASVRAPTSITARRGRRCISSIRSRSTTAKSPRRTCMTRRGWSDNLDNIHFYQRTMVCRDVVDNREMDLNTLYGCLAGHDETRRHQLSPTRPMSPIASRCCTWSRGARRSGWSGLSSAIPTASSSRR